MSPVRNRGQALVEFALVFPIFLLLLFGMIDLSRYVFVTNSANQAAREAARVNSVLAWTDACPSGTRDACVRTIAALHFQGASVPAPGPPGWTHECVDGGGTVRPGGLAGCRSGDVMEVSFRSTTFTLFTPVIAQLVPSPIVQGQATVAFNN